MFRKPTYHRLEHLFSVLEMGEAYLCLLQVRVLSSALIILRSQQRSNFLRIREPPCLDRRARQENAHQRPNANRQGPNSNEKYPPARKFRVDEADAIRE